MSYSNNKRNKTSPGSIIMRVAGILFALTAVTVWGTSFMLAKFTTGGQGDSKARVAEFDVDFTLTAPTDTPVISISDGGSGEYSIKLTNRSETAVRAELVFDFSMLNAKGQLFDKCSITIGSGTDAATKEYTIGSNNKVTLDKKYALGPVGTSTATQTVDFTLKFPAALIADVAGTDQDGWTALLALTKNMSGLSDTADEALPFDVFAVFTQID